jgi:hypothetical protein
MNITCKCGEEIVENICCACGCGEKLDDDGGCYGRHVADDLRASLRVAEEVRDGAQAASNRSLEAKRDAEEMARATELRATRAEAARDEATGDVELWKGRLEASERLRGKLLAERDLECGMRVNTEGQRDLYRKSELELRHRLDEVGDVLGDNWCDCECRCTMDGDPHGADCEPCLACKIEATGWPKGPKS